jgi:hypothetical protein
LPPFATGSVPVTPVVRGNPVALVSVTLVGVPRTGVISVGEVCRTFVPVPVVDAYEVTFEPAVVVMTPVNAGSAVAGSAVAFVRLMADGVPRAGVTRVGDVLSTLDPVPVEVVTPVPPFATARVPVTPDAGADVAAMVPVPVAERLAPDPTTIAAAVLVPLVSAENAVLPPPPHVAFAHFEPL